MADTDRVQALLDRNNAYAETYKAPPTLKEMMAGAGPKGKQVVILTCSDPRVIPEDFFDFSRGEYAVIRNAGGRAMDALRSILILGGLVPNGTIVVVHHTDCGLTNFTDEWVRNVVEKNRGPQGKALEEMKFGEIKDLRLSIKEDIAVIKSSPLLHPSINVLGMIYDLNTGRVEEVTEGIEKDETGAAEPADMYLLDHQSSVPQVFLPPALESCVVLIEKKGSRSCALEATSGFTNVSAMGFAKYGLWK